MNHEKTEVPHNNFFQATRIEAEQRLSRKKETQVILEMVGKEKGRVLDVGSNLGYLTKLIHEKTGSYAVGIDTNPSVLARKVEKNRAGQGVDFLRASGEEMPLQDESFDCAVASHVLEHFENPDRLLEEIKRVLKKDGELIIAVPKEKYLDQNSKDRRLWFFSVDDLISFLKPYGFQIQEPADLEKSVVAKFKFKI